MIELREVTVAFGEKTILEDVDLNISKGEVVSIIGPSGGGKSTLIRTMNGLVWPTSGSVWFDDEVLTHKNIDSVRTRMGMVFQQFELFPHLTVLANITMAPVALKKKTKAEAEKRAMELLDMVGLKDKALSYPSTLSGGQKQRIAIVRSLALDPEAMLFDEPTSALDPEMVKEVLSVIGQLAKSGMTIVVVTHEMAFAREISSRILFIDQKGIMADDTPEKVFSGDSCPRLAEFLSKVL